jgi:hypothetical protein
MRMDAAHDGHVQHPGHCDVIDEQRFAAEEPRVLCAFDALTEQPLR